MGLNNLVDGLLNVILVFVFARVVTIPTVIFFIALCVIGIMLEYFIWLAIVTIAFHTSKLEGAFSIFSVIRSRAKVPKDAYNGLNVILLGLIIPFLFAFTVPASVLAGKELGNNLIWYIIVFIIIGVASLTFWNFSIKKYASASS